MGGGRKKEGVGRGMGRPRQKKDGDKKIKFSGNSTTGLLPGPGQHGADHLYLPDPWLNPILQSGNQSSLLSNYVLFNSQIVCIVKKSTHRSSIESPKVSLKETTIGSVQNEAPDISLMCKNDFYASTKCEQCGFHSKRYCGLRTHIIKYHMI